MKIISLDPGVTTGFCVGTIEKEDGPLLIRPGQSKWTHAELWGQLMVAQPDIIICESFEYRNRARAGLVLYSCELIGIVHLYCNWDTLRPVELFMQTAAQGKGYWSDAHLKRVEIYKKAMPHGMDATRHLLQWFTFGAGYQYNVNGFQLA